MKKVELINLIQNVASIKEADEIVRAISSSTIRKSVKLDLLIELAEILSVNLDVEGQEWEEARDLFLNEVESRLLKLNDPFAHLVQECPNVSDGRFVGSVSNKGIQIESFDRIKPEWTREYVFPKTNPEAIRSFIPYSGNWYNQQVFRIGDPIKDPENLDLIIGNQLLCYVERQSDNAVLDHGVKSGLLNFGLNEGYISIEEYETTEVNGKKVTQKKWMTTKTVFDRYQDELITLSGNHEIIARATDPKNGLTIKVVRFKNICRLYVPDSDGEYHNVEKESEIWTEKMAPYTTEYLAFAPSPSNIRGEVATFIKVDTNPDKFRHLINAASFGGFDVVTGSYKGEPVKYGKAAKTSARFSLGTSDSMGLPVKPRIIAIYTGKYGVVNEVETHDGAFFVNTNMILKAYEDQGFKMRAKDLGSLGIQTRLGFVKGLSKTTNPRLMAEMVLHLFEHNEAMLVIPDKGEELKIAMDAQHGKYNGNDTALILYGLDMGTEEFLMLSREEQLSILENVDILADDNAVKAQCDWALVDELRILEIARSFKSTVSIWNQVMVGYLAVPGSIEVMRKHLLKAVKDIFAPERVKKLTAFKNVKEVEYLPNTLASVMPSVAASCSNLVDKAILDKVEQAKETIDSLSVPVSGINVKVFPDPGSFFGYPLVHAGEIYNNRHAGKEFNSFRAPKSYKGEIYKGVIVGYKTICDRIDEGVKERVFSKELARLLKQEFRTLKSGLVFVPSHDPLFATSQGGLDYDGDAIFVIFEKEFIELGRKLESTNIDYGKAEGTRADIIVDEKLCPTIFHDILTSINKNVGVVVNFAMTLNSWANAIDSGTYTQKDHGGLLWRIRSKYANILEHGGTAFEYDTQTIITNPVEDRNYGLIRPDFFMSKPERYESQKETLLHDVLNIQRIDRWIDYSYSHDVLRVEDFRLWLEDAMIIMVAVVGHTIDAAKSGAEIHVPFFWLTQDVRGGFLIKIAKKQKSSSGSTKKIELLDIKTGYVKTKEYDELGNETGNERTRLVLNDELVQLKNEAIQLVRDLYVAAVKEAEQKQEFVIDTGIKVDGLIIASTKKLASMRNALMDCRRSEAKDAKKYITSMERQILAMADLTPEQRFQVVKSASRTPKGTYTGFWTDFVPETVYAALQGHDGYLVEKLYAKTIGDAFKVGSVLHFENGLHERAYLGSKVSGDFTVGINEFGEAIVYTTIKEYMAKADNAGEKLFIYEAPVAKGVDKEKRAAAIIEEVKKATKTKIFFGMGQKNGLYIYTKDGKYRHQYLQSVQGGTPVTNPMEALCNGRTGREVIIDNVLTFQNVSKRSVVNNDVEETVIDHDEYIAVMGRFVD